MAYWLLREKFVQVPSEQKPGINVWTPLEEESKAESDDACCGDTWTCKVGNLPYASETFFTYAARQKSDLGIANEAHTSNALVKRYVRGECKVVH